MEKVARQSEWCDNEIAASSSADRPPPPPPGASNVQKDNNKGVQGEEGLDRSEVDLRLDLREHPVRSGFSGAPGEKDAKEFPVIFFVAADHNRHSEVSSRRVQRVCQTL